VCEGACAPPEWDIAPALSPRGTPPNTFFGHVSAKLTDLRFDALAVPGYPCVGALQAGQHRLRWTPITVQASTRV
jgi:hypothetical protein